MAFKRWRVRDACVMILILCLHAGLVTSKISGGQFPFHYPSLEWRVYQSRHFDIHYHRGSESCAALAADMADPIYRRVQQVYPYPTRERLHFMVSDEKPEANGEAFSDSDMLTVWCTNLASPFRGTMNGMQTVFAHELAHVLTLKRQSHASELATMFRLRFDHGYHDNDVTHTIGFPIHDINRAIWWTEGIAEWVAYKAGYNQWTPRRDMFLRSNFLDAYLLGWNELQLIVDKRGQMGERVYNTGFDFLRYLEKKYGANKILEIGDQNARSYAWNWDINMRRTFGASGGSLYRAWQKNRLAFYRKQIKGRGKKPGKIAVLLASQSKKSTYVTRKKRQRPVGTTSFRLSPNGRHATMISDAYPYNLTLISAAKKGKLLSFPLAVDAGQSSLKTKEFNDVALEPARFWPDNGSIVFSKKVNRLIDFRRDDMIDLYRFHIASGHLQRLTKDMRAQTPAISKDGRYVAFSSCFDHTCKIYVHNVRTRRNKVVFNGRKNIPGFWVYMLDFAPDGRSLLVSYQQLGDAHIAILNLKTQALKKVIGDHYDNSDAMFIEGGRRIVYQSIDPSGFANVYVAPRNGLYRQRITDVKSGTASPFYHAREGLFFSRYSGFMFRIHRLKKLRPQQREPIRFVKSPTTIKRWAFNKKMGSLTKLSMAKQKRILKRSKPYSALAGNYQPVILMPLVGYKNRSVFAGLSMVIQDYHKHHEFSFDLELGKTTNIVARYENKQFLPKFRLFIAQSRLPSDNNYYGPDPQGSGSIISYGTLKTHFTTLTASLGIGLVYNENGEISLNSTYTDSQYRSSYTYNQPVSYYRGILTTLDFVYWAASFSDLNPRGGRNVTVSVGRIDPLTETFSEVGWQPTLRVTYAHTEFFALPFGDNHSFDTHVHVGWLANAVHANDRFVHYSGSSMFQHGFNALSYVGAGYEVGAASGEKLFAAAIAYRFPLYQNLNKRLGIFYFKDLFLSIFSSTGNAWTTTDDVDESWFSRSSMNGHTLLTDVGSELRMGNVIFNNWTWDAWVNIAYPLQALSGSWDVDNDRETPLSPQNQTIVETEQSPRLLFRIGARY